MRLFFRPKTDSVSDPFFYRKKVVFIPQDPLRTPPGPSWGALGARRWILLVFVLILGSIWDPKMASEFPGGPKGPPKKPKNNEERAKVTAAGAEGDRQKYMTVGICRLFRFRVVLGRLWWRLGPFWDLFRYHFRRFSPEVRKCIIHGKNHTIVRVGRPENRPEFDHKSMKKQGLGKTKKTQTRADGFFAETGFLGPPGFPRALPGDPKRPPKSTGRGPREAQGPSRNRAEISSNFGRFWPPPPGRGGRRLSTTLGAR